MGLVTVDSGSQVNCENIEGTISLKELYEDAQNPHYTDAYRIICLRACGTVGRAAWGILSYLHKLEQDVNLNLVAAAKEAIGKIDPGRPNFGATIPGEKKASRVTPVTPTTPVIPIIEPRPKTFPRQTATGIVHTKLERTKITVTDLPSDLTSGTRVYCTCGFCEKISILPRRIQEFNKSVVNTNKMYCTFCLRNGLTRPRVARNTLMLTYRSLVAYYYHCFHLTTKHPSMHLLDLQSYIDMHVKFGMQNPLFRYDPETYVWFVDFSRVGAGDRRVGIEHVLETVVQQLSCFNLYENVKDVSGVMFYNKYKEAITDFLYHRRRPAGQKILCPTLYGCGIPHDTSLGKAISNEWLKQFTAVDLVEGYKLKQKYAGY